MRDWAREGRVVRGIQREGESCERRQEADLRAAVVADQWDGCEVEGMEGEIE